MLTLTPELTLTPDPPSLPAGNMLTALTRQRITFGGKISTRK
jgi:hypothetical protein